MASPHAAGALAVILQLNPGLDALQARDLLVQGARADAFTGPVPNSIFGGGKLHVLGGAEAVLKLVPDVTIDGGGALAWSAEPHSVTYNVYRGDLPGSPLPASYGTCLASALPAPAYDDTTVPPSGAAFLYLVTGVRDGIEGSLGFDGAGRQRPNASPCP
jgi:subtilisin family serine protease